MRKSLPPPLPELEESIYHLFSFASSEQLQTFIWLWLKSTVCGNFNSVLEESERELILALYEHLETLLAASGKYYQENKARINDAH